jgi:ATP-binding cassette subfamily F protein uup
LIVVSHDRSFVDRTVEEVLALDGSGGASLVRGGVAGWMASRSSSADNRSQQKAVAVASAARTSVPEAEPAPTPATPAKAVNRRSPSTLRRLISQAERDLAVATKRRDEFVVQLSSGGDHRHLAKFGEGLAKAETEMAHAEERWLALAHEADEIGLNV